MAWITLSSRLSSLPLVLAGPIVRKTTSISVSVWIALKNACDLELVISSASTEIIGRSPVTSTKKFGKNLHIALISANGLNLTPGQEYFYDINFGNLGSLITEGILATNFNDGRDGINEIIYSHEKFMPSFILPSDEMGSLKIIHASCRKPHGGVVGHDDTDAFVALDTILSNTIHQTDKRPQQLFLTGDQIYADDVSDILLFMLRDAEKALLGWQTREQLPSAPSVKDLGPLHRIPLTKKAGFENKEGNSHLLRLGEFYCMYLFVWSRVLWPTQSSDFPGFVQEYVYAVDDEEFEIKDEYTQEKYQGKVNVLLNFFKTIGSVRKALANISTYMIFDDHEITDDWNLNQTWVKNVYASLDGIRIIQNGLSAYAVFQGWGNKPEDFSKAASDEKLLLDALVTLNQHGEAGDADAQGDDFGNIAGLVIPNTVGTDLSGGIDWSYSLSFDKYNIIVLNARTNRALLDSYAGLLSNRAMVSQIRNRVSENLPSHEFTLIIAPAPVFGLPLMEELVQPIFAEFKGAAAADLEPWSADQNKFQQFLKEISVFERVLLLSGDVHYAFSNSVDYWDLRSGIEKRSKLVNLIASSLKNSTNGPKGTIFLADAINNHIPEILLQLGNDGLYVGWDNPGDYIITEVRTLLGMSAKGTVAVNRAPYIYKLAPYVLYTDPNDRSLTSGQFEKREWVDLRYPPQWEYKIIFEHDFRGDNERMAGTMPTISASAGVVGSGTRHGTIKSIRNNHTIVGQNNIGEITFQWGVTEDDKKIVHKIWSKVGSEFIPHTIHLVDFGIPAASDQKPSKIGRVS